MKIDVGRKTDTGTAGHLCFNPVEPVIEDETHFAPQRDFVTVSESPPRTIGNMWTAKKPCVDGFYWMRRRESMSEPPIIVITKVLGGLAYFMGDEEAMTIDRLSKGWLFSGPILPPE